MNNIDSSKEEYQEIQLTAYNISNMMNLLSCYCEANIDIDEISYMYSIFPYIQSEIKKITDKI